MEGVLTCFFQEFRAFFFNLVSNHDPNTQADQSSSAQCFMQQADVV